MSDKYTIMVIPDDEKESKTYNISRKTIKNLKYLSLAFLLFLGFTIYKTVPSLLEQNNLKAHSMINLSQKEQKYWRYQERSR